MPVKTGSYLWNMKHIVDKDLFPNNTTVMNIYTWNCVASPSLVYTQKSHSMWTTSLYDVVHKITVQQRFSRDVSHS